MCEKNRFTSGPWVNGMEAISALDRELSLQYPRRQEQIPYNQIFYYLVVFVFSYYILVRDKFKFIYCIQIGKC